MKAFALVSWQIYVAIGLGVFKSLVNPMCRTMITNLLPADERGKYRLYTFILCFLPLSVVSHSR